MSTQHPFKIVIAVDLSDWSERVFMSALTLAKSRAPAEVHVLAVAELNDSPFSLNPNAGQVPPEAIKKLEDYTRAKMSAFEQVHGTADVASLTAHVLLGAPADEIVWLAAHLDADLIVLGTHGRKGIRRVLLGSVAERVIRHAGCPVMVERPKEHNPKVRVPDIDPPVSKEHPAHHLHNHHYVQVHKPRENATTWGGSNL